MSLRLVILGPPGSGKGTQARRLAEETGTPHISTGEIFRKEGVDKTELGRLAASFTDEGNLVPDDVVIKIVAKRLSEKDCQENGFFLDGFPRTIPQAEALEEWLSEQNLPLDAAVLLDVTDKEVLKKRLTGRKHCPSCGKQYNVFYRPPDVKGHCDACDAELQVRADDTLDAILHRFEVDSAQTRPLYEYYEKKDQLLKVDGGAPVEEITETILSKLGQRSAA